MTPEQLIDQLAAALNVPERATRLIIERDWEQGYLRVTCEVAPEVDEAQADIVLRNAQDFDVRELDFRQSIEIESGS